MIQASQSAAAAALVVDQTLNVASSVRYVAVDGCVVLLDLKKARYLVLDALASRMWTAATSERSWIGERERILTDYACDAQELDRDWQKFRADCMARGWLHDAAASCGWPPGALEIAHRSSFPAPSLYACYLLWRFRRETRQGRSAALYTACQRANDGSVDQIDPVPLLRAFRRGEALFFTRAGPDDCLVRSLGLFYFLRTAGIACRHRIGVRRQPFLAHGWVELEGQCLLDERGVSTALVPIATLG